MSVPSERSEIPFGCSLPGQLCRVFSKEGKWTNSRQHFAGSTQSVRFLNRSDHLIELPSSDSDVNLN